MSQLLTVKQAAYILKVHPLTIRRYIKEKKLTAIKAAGNIRIKEEDLNSMHIDPTTVDHQTQRKQKIEPIKFFGFEDPLWRLKGRAASLSLPEGE